MTPRFITYTTPKEIEQFTSETNVTKNGATLTYGPYNNIPASANVKFMAEVQQIVQVHYYHDFPVLELTSLKRSAEISHWGANLNIQDEITLHNAGPKCVSSEVPLNRILTDLAGSKVTSRALSTKLNPSTRALHHTSSRDSLCISLPVFAIPTTMTSTEMFPPHTCASPRIPKSPRRRSTVSSR